MPNMNRVVLFGVIGFLVTIVGPLYFVNQLQLGKNAKSPQTLKITQGEVGLIGGGRAKLWYAGGHTGGDFEVSCPKETRYISPEKDKDYQGCGLRIRFLDVKLKDGFPSKATYRIEW